MFNIEIRADGTLHIEGYVNAVERDSRPVICGECGKCVEQVKAGVFDKALRAAKNVDMLLNHNKCRKLASTTEGTLSLAEDSIGLRASADITDKETIEKARTGKLRGWSFGFKKLESEIEERADKLPRRILKAIDIFEVSVIDDTHTPCYAGTSIEMRAENETEEVEVRSSEETPEITIEAPEPAVHNEWCEPYERYLALDEKRFNPYHDPTNGRFTDANGGGAGSYLFSKGGKTAYVVPKEDFKKKRTLDKKMIDRANAQGSNIYNAGSAVERTLNKHLSEIDTLDISDERKEEAKDKIFEYANAELKERSQYIDFYTAGPARDTKTRNHLDKAVSISGEHEGYMKALRNESAKNTKNKKENAFKSAFDVEVNKANASGAREITVNGETWFRTTKTSSTWTKGSLSEHKAKQKFLKSQKDIFIGNRKAWSDLSEEEKQKYYRAESDDHG